MPKVVDREERRRLVADAAFRVIAAEGLAAVTLQKVATEAALNIGSLRHYVDNYDELLVFAMRSMIDRVSDRVSGLVEEASHAAEPRLALTERLMAQFLPLDDERRLEVTVWVEFSLAARVRPELAALSRKSAEGTRHLVQRVVARIEGADASAAGTERLMSLVDGLALNCLLHPDIVTPAKARQALHHQLESMITS